MCHPYFCVSCFWSTFTIFLYQVQQKLSKNKYHLPSRKWKNSTLRICLQGCERKSPDRQQCCFTNWEVLGLHAWYKNQTQWREMFYNSLNSELHWIIYTSDFELSSALSPSPEVKAQVTKSRARPLAVILDCQVRSDRVWPGISCQGCEEGKRKRIQQAILPFLRLKSLSAEREKNKDAERGIT